MPEAGAGTQGHDLSGTRSESFYAQAVNGSTFRAQNCPAHVRLLRGSVVLDGFRAGRRVRAL